MVVGSEAIIGIGTTSNPNVDLRFATDLGNSNVKRINDVVMLDYTDKVFIENKFATRVENVNPFNTPSWIGSIELNPSTDTWVETRRTQRTDDVEGNFEATMTQLGVDSNTGLSPVNWNAWETNWVGVSNVEVQFLPKFKMVLELLILAPLLIGGVEQQLLPGKIHLLNLETILLQLQLNNPDRESNLV